MSITGSRYIGIYGCELAGSGAIGVSAENSQGVNIDNCYIHDNNYAAFFFQDAGDITISRSTVVHNASTISGFNIGTLDMVSNVIAGNEVPGGQ